VINRLTIVGAGLIGSSLSLALKQAGQVGEVTGYGRSEQNLEKGVEIGVLDHYELDLGKAVDGADVVVLAVPLGAMKAVFTDLAPKLSDHTVITDVGSAKGTVVDDARAGLGEHFERFVPGHPIAGTEQSGVEAGFATLYQDRKIILTPVAETNADAVSVIEAMWQDCGAQVEQMSVDHHDHVLAATSHLPHMLAFSLVSHLSKMSDQDEIFGYAAGGFRDFTRIASSDPVMWRDICLSNGDALQTLIDGFISELGQVRDAIERRDPDALFELFRDAKHTRDQLRKL
jgi:prephenate dehydrogenase